MAANTEQTTSTPPERLGVYKQEGNAKVPVGRIELSNSEGGDQTVTLSGDSPEATSELQKIVSEVAKSESGGTSEKWKRLKEALEKNGFTVESLPAGDLEIKFMIRMDGGRAIGTHRALHKLVTPNDELARKIMEAVASAFAKGADELAQRIDEALASGAQSEIPALLNDGIKKGAFSMSPTKKLLDALQKIEVADLSRTDRRLVLDRRINTAQLLRAHQIAGRDASALLMEFEETLDKQRKADLQMILAMASNEKGHLETALTIWREVTMDPSLHAETRGWAWRNISLALSSDPTQSRPAARYSADAFLAAGNKEEAGRSLMGLANSLMSAEPAQAISTIDEIVRLMEDEGLANQDMRAEILRIRAEKLWKTGKPAEALADARKAIELFRGLLGAESLFASTLHLAGMVASALGMKDEADAFTAEVEKLELPRVQFAKRLDRLAQSFDPAEANQLLQEAEAAGDMAVVSGVRIVQALMDPSLSQTARLELLEETDKSLAGARDEERQPVRLAMARQLAAMGDIERATLWYQKILDADPFDLFARDSLMRCLWKQEKWADAAAFLKRQLDLRGSEYPGLLHAYGRSLFEAGDLSGAVDALTKASKLVADDSEHKKQMLELRERALQAGGTVRSPQSNTPTPAVVTSEEIGAALDEFAKFIAVEKRMGFWNKGDDYTWIENPERRAQDLLHTFLKARFYTRLMAFEERVAGAGRLDLYLLFQGGLAVIAELKMCGFRYASTYAAAGEGQLLHYMENREVKLGGLNGSSKHWHQT